MFKKNHLIIILLIVLVIMFFTQKKHDGFGNYFNDKSKCVRSLEKFETTSTGSIDISAKGDTGEEEFVVDINGVMYPSGNKYKVSKNSQVFKITTNEPIDLTKVKINFTNDGNNSSGIDKNIRIDYIYVNGSNIDMKNYLDKSGLSSNSLDMVKKGILAWGGIYTFKNVPVPTPNTYLEKFIRYNNGGIYYVDSNGLVRPITSMEIYNSIKGKNGCPESYVQVDTNDYKTLGLLNPPLVSGSNMNINEACIAPSVSTPSIPSVSTPSIPSVPSVPSVPTTQQQTSEPSSLNVPGSCVCSPYISGNKLSNVPTYGDMQASKK